MLEVQAGHSLGLAALKAQQRYVEQVNELDPIDLKTLAQFYLLGDPSVQPVKVVTATRTPPAGTAAVAKRSVRAARRANTERIGELLRETKPTASHPVAASPSANVRRQLNQIARQIGVPPASKFTTFAVECGRRRKARSAPVRGAEGVASKYHLLVTTADHLSKADVGSRVASSRARQASASLHTASTTSADGDTQSAKPSPKPSNEPKRVHALRGRVAEGPFARGSKSEQIAVFLETGAARYVLRRRDGPRTPTRRCRWSAATSNATALSCRTC